LRAVPTSQIDLESRAAQPRPPPAMDSILCDSSGVSFPYLFWVEGVPLRRPIRKQKASHTISRECMLPPTLPSITHLLLTRSLRPSLFRQPTSPPFSPKSASRVALHPVIARPGTCMLFWSHPLADYAMTLVGWKGLPIGYTHGLHKIIGKRALRLKERDARRQ
jgi:hypothetical protein